MRKIPAPLCLLLAGLGCRLEPPDPASEALAILSKRPASFVDRMVSMEALVLRHFPIPDPMAKLPDTLARWRETLSSGGFAAQSGSGKAETLVRFFFDQVALTPVETGDSLNLSLPGWVLQNRRGSCVGLASLFLALAELMDVPTQVVPLPGHLFVRIQSGPTIWRSVETLRGGVVRTDSFYRETFQLDSRPWYDLVSKESDFALAALVFNLANAHSAGGQTDFAISQFRMLSDRYPGFPDALGSEGSLLLAKGESQTAREKLAMSLAGDSLSFPAWAHYAMALEKTGDSNFVEARLRSEMVKPK